MNLKDIIKDLKIEKILGQIELEIEDIVYDSKKAVEKTLFTALIGMTSDGHKYIKNAYLNGARVFVISREEFLEEKENIEIIQNSTFILVEDTRIALATMSAEFFGHPSNELTIIGITGTKGKTTVSGYIKSVLDNTGISCGVIGTNGIYFANQYFKTVNTTPESYEIQKYMRKMVDNGVKVLSMEVSSGGIMMNRVYGIKFDYAIFTNLSHDHIGEKEHPTFDHYKNCKSMLFAMSKHSIINIDDENSKAMIEKTSDCKTYSVDSSSDYQAKNIIYPSDISDMRTYFMLNDKKYVVNSFGKFGVYNALCTIILCEQLGLSYQSIYSGLEKAHVKGRLQVIEGFIDIKVIIDYAHNEVSLENILQTVKELKPKRLIVLFGSVGTRSQKRREELARVASKYGDVIIVTSDNPDTEDPQKIIDEIVSHISADKKGHTYCFPDRAEAIKRTLEMSKKGDVIVIAGKGHEEYQLINGVREHFSDEEEVKKYIFLNS